VQFHWDREGKRDQDSSCWIRVSQTWAGKSWGAFFLPRVGQEVRVEFLDGNPDRPLVTGSVYNGIQKTPYELPAHKNRATLKSDSTKGGGGSNELRFDDTKGKEQVFSHAQKDLDLRVEEELREWIGKTLHRVVDKDLLERVANDLHQKIGRHRQVEVAKDDHLKVQGKQSIEVADSVSLTVKGDCISAIKGDHCEQTTRDYYLKAKQIVLEALQGITIKCGGSSIVIDAAGVTVKGALVTLDGSIVKIASGPGSPPMSGAAQSPAPPDPPRSAREARKADE
jgi:type VI secretion system secreted protein VgrG